MIETELMPRAARTASPARQRKLALSAWYERGFSEARYDRPAKPPPDDDAEALASYRGGRRVGRRERERAA